MLESRQMLSMTVSLSGSTVNFVGDANPDFLTLTVGATGLLTHDLPLDGNLVSAVDLDSATAGEQSLAASAVGALTADAGEGNDWIDTTAFSGAVLIDGGGGDDTILSGDGNDTLIGQAGHDWLEAGAGD
ncbi:MAG: calcium-binding protein, partial [Planctomycetaceae bacterium]